MDLNLDEGIVVLDGVKQPFTVHSQETKHFSEGTYAHMHDYIEMLYCTGGKFEIFLNDTRFEFEKGDLVVINSREVHTTYSISPETGSYICVRFLPEILYTSSAYAFDTKYVMPFILNNSRHQRIFKRSEIENTFIPYLMYELLTEYDKKSYGYELAVKTDISRIFLWIVRYWHSLNVNLTEPDMLNPDMINRIQKALDYISENYSDDIKASEVAKHCNMSYSYFSRIFKQYMKKSFSEYLNYIRITNAEKLLASTDLSITEIAAECGFTTSSYFIKQFKEYKSFSPKHFRKISVKQ